MQLVAYQVGLTLLKHPDTYTPYPTPTAADVVTLVPVRNPSNPYKRLVTVSKTRPIMVQYVNLIAYVDKSAEVSRPKIVQYRSLVQVRHIGHVFRHLKLRGIHLLHVILFIGLHLKSA